MTRARTRRRLAYTVLELLVATTLASVLIAGITSTMFVAAKASSMETTGKAVMEGASVLADISVDLQYAVDITQNSATDLDVRVPDRDGDASNESVRYTWSGSPGDALTRRYNNGTISSVADNVHDFRLSYRKEGNQIHYVTVVLQISHDALGAVQTEFPLLNRPTEPAP